MNNYMQRLSLTAWRRKNTILVVAALLSLILFGLQYSVIEENNSINEERDAKVVEDALLHSIKVKFIEAANLNRPASTQTSQILKSEHLNQNSVLDRQTEKDFQVVESEQQLGIPYINIDTRNPYVPKQRLVHFDLKGAPLTLTYFRKVIPLVKHAGATGILLEYEDMFPYKGVLQSLAAKNAYTVDQVKEILRLIEDAKMDVIPLVQTFGHMEFALKHIDFQNIREVPGSPQSLCPSRNSSLDFIRELVEQVLDLHPKIKYLHIGCDEVFEMGECELCRLEMHETLFLRHVQNVANIVREIKPDLQVIIWDDMLRHLSQQSMQAMNLGNLVEPMIWVYAEDIYRFVQPPVWDKYSAIFKTAWTASAFKGAFGETVYIPNARRHLENNLHWLDVMATQSGVFKKGISGIVLTGWQRYDHFAVLCELLPASLPSLVINLITVSHGFFNSSLKNEFLTTLSCPQPPAGRAAPFINLESDPHMWDKLARCMFPGHGFFKLTYRLNNLENEAREYLDTTTRQRGWMTAYNAKHNYSLPLRVEELTADLPRVYHGTVSLAKSAADLLVGIVDNYTISEWIEQRIYPYIVALESIQNQSAVLKNVNHWPSRPLPPLTDLQRHGISLGFN